MSELITQIIVNTIYTTMVYVLIALSFNISYYPTKILNFSHAFIITLASYLYFSLYLIFSHYLIAIFASIILTTSTGIIIYKTVFHKLIKNGTQKWIILMASLGIYIILQNFISLIWGDNIKSLRFSDVKVGHNLLGAFITNIQIITILSCIFILILSVGFYRYTKIGKQMKATSSNLELSIVFGINQNKIFLLAFTFGSCIAAISGILIAFETNLTPTMGFNWLLYGVVAMIIGGIGSTWGLLGGALLLATAQHLSAYYIGSEWMDAVAYIILILFLIWKPLGFSGKRLKKVEI